MEPVVSDTSPLTNLAVIGEFALLQKLFGQVMIAEAVWEELNAGGQRWPGRDEVAGSPWIIRYPPGNLSLFTALRRDLDAGEAASIVLALELSAGLVLMDELDGRHQARRQGLRTMGVVGVLLLAKRRGLIPSVRPRLDALREKAHFWLAEGVYHHAIAEAGEGRGVESPS